MLRTRTFFRFILLGAAIGGLFACAPVTGVPGNAQLVWAGVYHNSKSLSDLTPASVPGEIYIYDDTLKQLVAVRPARPGSMDFEFLDGHRYEVSFKGFED